jgi:hypothetical protein
MRVDQALFVVLGARLPKGAGRTCAGLEVIEGPLGDVVGVGSVEPVGEAAQT